MARKPKPELSARCAIAGGGPAGVLLGYLLARAGVEVVVLEKHADFFRDFRGDTVHPSTLEVMAELGLLEAFLKRPHDELNAVGIEANGELFTAAEFARVPTRCKFIAIMPQWDFLDFLADEARRFPAFRLLMNAEVEELIETDGRVTGLRARTPDGPLKVAADLVVGADGRDSVVREQGGLPVEKLGVPIDVLWMRISKRADERGATLGRFRRGRMLVTIDRGDYWQCAFLIRKGAFDEIRAGGLDKLRTEIAVAAPVFEDRLGELSDWDQVKLLTVRVERLTRWSRPGLLCIGDAAHAMSPVGGVGINLAIQDAVAAANLLVDDLRAGAPSPEALAKVQRRRGWPTRVIQGFQVFVHDNVLTRILGRDRPMPTWPLRLLRRFRPLRALPARFLGLGPRPEHISPGLRRLFDQAR